jgi:hypothetical protein
MITRASLLRLTVLALAAGAGVVAVTRRWRPRDVPTAQAAPAGQAARTLGPATFPHQSHLEDLGIACKDCHHETNATALRMPHEGYFDDFWIDCRICHNPTGGAAAGPQACAQCHHGSPASIADETLSAKVVIHKSCWGCHDSGTGEEASKGCSTCHVPTAGGPAAADSSRVSSKEG